MKWYQLVLPAVCLYLWHVASTTQESEKASEIKLHLGGRGGRFLPEETTSNSPEHGI